MLFLGTLLDTASIILIVVPLFLPLIEPMGLSLVWFGIVTVVGAEIGLLTPPLGISCFVIKATLNDDRITLKDVFLGALPFAAVMLGRADPADPLPGPQPRHSELGGRPCAPSPKTTSPTSSPAISATDTDPRLREVLTALAQHLHDFAREIEADP